MTELLTMMIGLPGAGKSTMAEAFQNTMCEVSDVLLVTDEIREELCDGDRADMSKNEEVFQTLHKRVLTAMKNGQSICVDATNINKKYRAPLMNMAQDYDYGVKGVVFVPDVEVCKEQNPKRDWPVPEEVIDMMFEKWESPTVEEGFMYIESSSIYQGAE